MKLLIVGTVLIKVVGMLDVGTIGAILIASVIAKLIRNIYDGGIIIIGLDTNPERRIAYKGLMKMTKNFLIMVILSSILWIWCIDALDMSSFISTVNNVFAYTIIPYTFHYDLANKATDNIEEDDKQ